MLALDNQQAVYHGYLLKLYVCWCKTVTNNIYSVTAPIDSRALYKKSFTQIWNKIKGDTVLECFTIYCRLLTILNGSWRHLLPGETFQQLTWVERFPLPGPLRFDSGDVRIAYVRQLHASGQLHCWEAEHNFKSKPASVAHVEPSCITNLEQQHIFPSDLLSMWSQGPLCKCGVRAALQLAGVFEIADQHHLLVVASQHARVQLQNVCFILDRKPCNIVVLRLLCVGGLFSTNMTTLQAQICIPQQGVTNPKFQIATFKPVARCRRAQYLRQRTIRTAIRAEEASGRPLP